MRIRALINYDETPGWMRWRITQPYRHMNNYGIDIDTQYADVGSEVDADIIVLPRLIAPRTHWDETREWLDGLRRNGSIIVYEADDDVWSESYVENLSKVLFKPGMTTMQIIGILDELNMRRECALWTLNQCDAVTVSTEPLADYIRTITNLPVHVVPNAIDVDYFRYGLLEIPNWRVPPLVTVGWAGGARNESELTPMLEAWSIIAPYHKNLRFVIAGFQPNLSAYPTLEGRVTSVPYLGFDVYGRSMQVDIGCCSVNDSPFCQRKSAIKAWEFATAGALPIACKTVYGDDIVPNVICNDVEDWVMALNHYITHPDDRHDLMTLSQMCVESHHDLKFEWRVWANTYKAIYDSKRMGVLESRVENSPYVIVG